MKVRMKPWGTAALVATLLAISVAGCTATSTSTSTSTKSSATQNSSPVTPTSPADSTAANPTPASSPTPAWNVAKDTGPASGANGKVTDNEEGSPVQYVVAGGDTGGGICARLHVRWWQLKSGADFLGTYPELRVGEVIDIVDVPESAAGDVESSNALC